MLKIQVEQAIQDMKLSRLLQKNPKAGPHKTAKKCSDVQEIRKKEIIYTLSFPQTVPWAPCLEPYHIRIETQYVKHGVHRGILCLVSGRKTHRLVSFKTHCLVSFRTSTERLAKVELEKVNRRKVCRFERGGRLRPLRTFGQHFPQTSSNTT